MVDTIVALILISLGFIFYFNSISTINHNEDESRKNMIESRIIYEKKKGVYND